MIVSFADAFSGRRVLVTGGAGFVGGAVTRRLADTGATVTVLDDLFTGSLETLPPGVEFVRGSVTEQALPRCSSYPRCCYRSDPASGAP